MLLLEELYIRVPFINLLNQDVSLSLKRNAYTLNAVFLVVYYLH